MSTKFLSPGWRMPRNANQSKQSNYSMYIDVGGSSSNIDTNYYLPSGTNPKSISFWLKNVDPNGWITTGYQYTVHGGALSTGQGFGVGIIGSSSGAYIWFIGHSTADYFIPSSATGTMTTNVWYHIVVTYDNTRTNNLHFYLDGVKIDEANESLNTSSANSVKIGANATGGGGSGSQYVYVNQVCFFDYALSSSQVTTLWGGGTSVSNPMALPSPPKAYYPLGTSAWNGQYLAENNAIGDYVFDFDGVDDYIDCSSISSIPSATELTVSFWANTNSTSQNQVVFGDNSSSPIFSFEYWGSSNKMFFEYGTGTYAYLTLTSVVTAGNWHNVVLVYNASGASNTDKIKIYVDGVDKSSLLTYVGTIPTSLNASIGNFWIGNGQNYNQSFNGKISNAQIFNTALPATDVETLYNYGSPIRTLANIPQSSNLKAWYKLDASEIYNSSTTDWSVDNNKYPSTYNSSINLVRASSQKIDIANGSELDFTGDFTMSIWVNLTTSNNNMGIFNKTSQANSNGVTLFKRGGANFEFYVSEYSNVLTFASQGDNIWQQITITLNRTTGERVAYINGEQAATLTHIKTFAFPNQGWDIGTFATNSLNYLDAKVSNFKLFNTVLSPTEVQTLYNNGTPLTDMSSFTSLKGWWKLNNLSSGLTDSSSNSNNATITSGTNEYAGFVNALAGDSSGMNQSNLVQSDLQTVAPYSKYAMNFDGVSEKMAFNSSPIDLGLSSTETWWIKYSNSSATSSSIASAPVFAGFHILYEKSTNKVYYRIDSTNLYYEWVIPSTYFTDNLWHHYAIVRDDNLPFSSYIKLYIDGNLFGNPTAVNATSKSTTNTKITDWGGASAYPGIVGDFSNVAFWNTALTASEAKEIYNEGLPSNLHNFSGTAPVAWWQMGSNSSYVNGWICADEIGANNGATSNIGEESLVNGVGTTANGTSTGMSEGNLVGNAPYSTGNPISSGMAVTAKGTDVPPGIEVDFLVIAGGGGGGSDPGSGWGGGGGAGGYRNSYNNETSGGGSSAENNLLLSANTNYTVTVGNGGAGDTNGQDSVFATITSVGGGAGGASPTDPANNGGSGGGAARNNIGGNGTGTANQGFDGSATTNTVRAGGGGGAGSAGGSGVGYGYANSPDADGGIGLESSITGTAVKRGGGGSAPYGGAGTWGGGEAPTGGVPSSGTPNTGGGGGGRRNAGSGATGGSGVVILRYSNTKTITVGAGLTTAGEQTDGSDKYIVFTAGTGNVSFS